MLKNMRIKTSLLLLLLLFTFMQFFSNGFELVDLKGNQKNTLLLHNIIKEQDTCIRSLRLFIKSEAFVIIFNNIMRPMPDRQ